MAEPRRILRLQQLILETVAQFLQREAKDPRIGIVSVTRVKLAKDLSAAQIGWSCLGSDADRRKTERGLEDIASAVQREVARTLQTRVTPKISFRYDETLQHAQALEEVFEAIRQDKIAHGEPVDDEPPEGDGEEG